MVLGSAPDVTGQDPSVLDASGGNGTGGAAGGAGSAGSTGSGGTTSPPNENAAGTGGAGGTPVSVPGAPSVVSVSPPNGATGVAAETAVTLTFSEAMEPSSVQSAYSSSDLGLVDFNWSLGNTVLQIVPKQPLARALGTDPATTAALSYTFQIGTAALDAQGEALPRFTSSFSTQREIQQTLVALQDRSLTGNWRSDDTYGNNSCQESDVDHTTCIGDSSNANAVYRGFVTFDLSALPTPTPALSAAQLEMTIDLVRGSPFAFLGTLVAEHVRFDSISLVAFNAAALGTVINVTSSATPAALSTNVLSSVQEDLSARGYSQFRFRFSIFTNSDGSGDLVEVLGPSEKLTVSWLIP